MEEPLAGDVHAICPKLLAFKGPLRPGHPARQVPQLPYCAVSRLISPYCALLRLFRPIAPYCPELPGFQGKALELPAFRASPARQTPQHSSVGGQRSR